MTVNWAGTAFSLVLVAVAAGLSLYWGLGLERSIVWAALRAGVQLLLVGGILVLLLRPGTSLWWSWLWVAAMLGYATWTAKQRAPGVPRIVPLALTAFVVATALTMVVLFGFGVFSLAARTLVPIAGLVVGNAMTSTVLAARRMLEEFADKRDEIEARLALGQPSRDAARPYVRGVLRSALSPQIETTKATGLVFLPGAMTGLILGGADPISAVLVQVVVMFLVLASASTTTTVVALGLSRRLFTADHRLVRVARSAT
ncbi:iron export ABC transporter permease subunit FetB [Actinomycetospora endophytica]|uniref:Iron export ABC transporter permease subunit FetB n=1 Tax=Actinomycetospora endophytica TaxID=2291215 RepID=A0ABS8P8D6_9PSEU|nr:iron export ABC transporter permease subunit FetB [Actinomycetospora endophytica]MCD2194513.1 iron export ABC transporter permease subunit FetB [Actinomycetospora endophytica]